MVFPQVKGGAGTGTRTPNRPITSRVRYQLRHAGGPVEDTGSTTATPRLVVSRGACCGGQVVEDDDALGVGVVGTVPGMPSRPKLGRGGRTLLTRSVTRAFKSLVIASA